MMLGGGKNRMTGSKGHIVVARGRARPPRTTTIPPSGGAATAVGKADGGVEQQQAAPSGAPHWGGISPANSRRAAAPRRLFLPPVPWRYPRGWGGLRVGPLPPL